MSTTADDTRERILSPAYAATTIAMFALIAFAAFEAMAVTTVMPTVARDLGGLDLYALAFAAPLASGVVGMVAAGMWSDRTGPVVPLLASLALFSAGLLVCGLAPSMEVLLAGRVLQGLGGGALTVGLYVIVGLVFPAALRPAVFASFAAAWVLPSLFGPGLAALVADVWSWRWVFLGTVGFVALALVLLAPALRRLEPHAEGVTTPSVRLWWAVLGAVAVLALELLGSARGVAALGAVAALTGVWVSLGRLLPPGSRTLRRGLPAVVATRGLLAATFFCAEAYIVYVLQEHWGLSPGRAGIALTCVGVVWATASQVQSRLGERVSHTRAMMVGTALVLTGPDRARAVGAGPRRRRAAVGPPAGGGVRRGRRGHGLRLPADRGGDAGGVDRPRPGLQLLGPDGGRLARRRAGAVGGRCRVRGCPATGPRPVPHGLRLRCGRGRARGAGGLADAYALSPAGPTGVGADRTDRASG